MSTDKDIAQPNKEEGSLGATTGLLICTSAVYRVALSIPFNVQLLWYFSHFKMVFHPLIYIYLVTVIDLES